MNLPNLISLARLLVTPVAVWLMLTGAMAAAFWVFLAAAVSDALDGLIAKRFDQVTVLGAYLDPLADKALLVSIYVVLGMLDRLPLWLVLLVVFRDILILGGALLLWLHARSFRMRPLMVSKVNTTAQIVLAAAVLAIEGLGLALDFAVQPLVYMVAVTTLISGASSVAGWLRSMAEAEAGE